MQCEIRKREYNSAERKTVAVSSAWTWAKKIVDALRLRENCDFGVFVGNKEIKTEREVAGA